MPVVQLAAHAKSSTLYGRLYGRTVVHPIFFRLDGLLLFCIITGLRPASSAITADTTWKLLVHVITVNNYFPFPEFFFSAIGDHVKCNLAKVPSHAVMTKKGSSNKANYASILIKASDAYGNDTGSVFRMFDSSKWDGKDLLFKDSTVKLIDVGGKTYDVFLGDSYLKDLEALNACPTTPNSGTKLIMPYLIGSVVFVLTALFVSGTVHY